ncbi:TPA: hypothetical protein UN084_002982 [Stenotrophomonas maltophilia]|nr:hypothetical protein [Stenotrophomonas maltophilia]
MSDYSTHPLSFVRGLVEQYGEDITFSFSRYFYRPRSPVDEREIIQVSAKLISDAWLEDEMNSLLPNWDLALNSVVLDSRGRTRHIPMIDFIGDAARFFIDRRSRDIVGHRIYDEMIPFSSGRSLHGYSSVLLAPGEWISYMARLLLVDFPDEDPMIDHRWVGHRLAGGYSALRWSANGDNYLDYPRRFDLAASGILAKI